jgi:hypothetical protein
MNFYSFLSSSVPGGRARWLFGTFSGVLSLADIRTTFISEDTVQVKFHNKNVLLSLQEIHLAYSLLTSKL